MIRPTWVALLALIFALGYYCLNRAVILHYNRPARGEFVTWSSGPSSWWVAQNRGAGEQELPGHTVANGLNGDATITFLDDEYYITPPENWLAGNGWRRSPGVGRGSLVRRTPGYSLWYLAHRLLLGSNNVFKGLLVSQLLLYILSALAFWRSLIYLKIRPLLVTMFVLVFTLTPFFNTYTFYTLTESLVVPILIFLMYFLLRAYYDPNTRSKRNAYLMAGLLWGTALLTRPFTGICLVSVVWVMFYDYVQQSHNWLLFIRRGVQVAIVPVLMVGTWTVRNYVATGGDLVILERYSHPETFDVFRPSFNTMFSLYMSAGVSQADFYTYAQPLFSDVTKSGVKRPKIVSGLVNAMPALLRESMGKKRFQDAIEQYQFLLITAYHPYIRKDRPMPVTYGPAELAVVDTFKALHHDLLRLHPLLKLTGPLSVVKEAVFNSNTSSVYAFQAPFRNAFPLINLPRYVFLALHVGTYVTMLYGIIWFAFRKKTKRLGPWPVALAAPSILLILFLSVTVMTTEQRYQLVFLAYLVLFAGLVIDELFGNRPMEPLRETRVAPNGQFAVLKKLNIILPE